MATPTLKLRTGAWHDGSNNSTTFTVEIYSKSVYVITECPKNKGMSVTNNIENVVNTMFKYLGIFEVEQDTCKVYQFCTSEGLFLIDRSGVDTQWVKVSDDMKAIKVLYGQS